MKLQTKMEFWFWNTKTFSKIQLFTKKHIYILTLSRFRQRYCFQHGILKTKILFLYPYSNKLETFPLNFWPRAIIVKANFLKNTTRKNSTDCFKNLNFAVQIFLLIWKRQNSDILSQNKYVYCIYVDIFLVRFKEKFTFM